MAELELFSLQRAAGGGNVAEPALLALPGRAPRQVQDRFLRAHGKSSGPPDRKPIRPRTRNLDSRCFARRGAGRQRPGAGNAAYLSGPPRSNFDDDRYGAATRPQALRRRKRILFPDGFRVFDSALFTRVAAGIGRAGGNRVLAELLASGTCERIARRSGERPHF